MLTEQGKPTIDTILGAVKKLLNDYRQAGTNTADALEAFAQLAVAYAEAADATPADERLPDLTVMELRALREGTEQSIRNTLRRFTHVTGVNVTSVDLLAVGTLGGGTADYVVTLEVTL